MVDKVINDARVYTDIQGLETLRYQKNTNQTKKEVAQQFESMLMQMVMRSMREANQAFASDLLDNDQMDFYQDMFDKQLSMMTSTSGLGFAGMVEKNINQTYFPQQKDADKSPTVAPQPLKTMDYFQHPTNTQSITPQIFALPVTSSITVNPDASSAQASTTAETVSINTPEDFVQKLWAGAKAAAKLIGTDPKILIAQAALETNWGKKILPNIDNNASSHNLFNIKADSSWTDKTTTMATLEQKNGVVTKEKSTFRSYSSFADSFKDYANFIKSNSRYKDALNKASDPQLYIQALQDAGYATDYNYAAKTLKIFSSPMLKKLTDKIE